MTTVWEIIFWVCMGIVVYTYVGYGILLYFILKIRRMLGFHRLQPVLGINRDLWPEVTLMVCAYNEEDIVEAKMDNTNELDYPKDKLHVLWVTDGSTDDTNKKLAQYPQVEVAYSAETGNTVRLSSDIYKASNGVGFEMKLAPMSHDVTNVQRTIYNKIKEGSLSLHALSGDI